MTSPLSPRTGKGKELCDMLRKELGVPDGVLNFEVRFAIDELVTVRCEYRPHEPEVLDAQRS